MESAADNRRVACLSIKNIDRDVEEVCQEIGSYLVDCGYILVVEKKSPFIPQGIKAGDHNLQLISETRPVVKHYERAKEIIDFSKTHMTRSREVVRKLASVLESITFLVWSSFDGKTDETLRKITEAARKDKIPTFDISDPKEFDIVVSKI